jgi:hypothetical protein
MTTAQLINKLSSRVLEWQTLMKILQRKNVSILPLKVFACVYFMKDNRLTVRKLVLEW